VKGVLESVDNFMNMKLIDVIYSTSDAKKFWKIKEGFIRGNNINSINFQNNLLNKIEEMKESKVSELACNRIFYKI
jgi:U6 snRNA-associated Sm-like protein LSm4